MSEATKAKEAHRAGLGLGIDGEVDLMVTKDISDPDTMTLIGAEALGLTAPKRVNSKFEALVQTREDEEAASRQEREKFLEEVEARLTGNGRSW